MFVCLFGFFFPLLIIVFLHQNPHLESDIANFKPCLSIPLLTSLSEPQSARSTGVSLGSAEKAKAQAEASIGAGGRRNQRRLHFNFVYLEQGVTNMSHVKGHRNLLHSLALLLYWCVGTWEQLCLDILSQAPPWFSFNSTDLMISWAFSNLDNSRILFTSSPSATLLEKAQEPVKA